MAAGSLLVPVTRRELAAAVARSSAERTPSRRPGSTRAPRHPGPLGGPRRRLGPAPRLRAAPGRLVGHRPAPVAPARRAGPAGLLRPDAPAAAQDARLRPERGGDRERRRHRRRHARVGAAGGRRCRRARLLRAVLRHQPDEPALDGLRRRAALPRGRLRPGLGEPDRPPRGLLLRQPPGRRRRVRADRRPPGRTTVRRPLRLLPGAGRRAGPRSPGADARPDAARRRHRRRRRGSAGRSRWRSSAPASRRWRGSTRSASTDPVAGPSVSARPSAMARILVTREQDVAQDEAENRRQERRPAPRGPARSGSGCRPRPG